MSEGRDRVESVAAPWVAAGEPPESQPAAANESVRDHGVTHVVCARRLEATGAGKQRRNQNLIGAMHRHDEGAAATPPVSGAGAGAIGLAASAASAGFCWSGGGGGATNAW